MWVWVADQAKVKAVQYFQEKVLNRKRQLDKDKKKRRRRWYYLLVLLALLLGGCLPIAVVMVTPPLPPEAAPTAHELAYVPSAQRRALLQSSIYTGVPITILEGISYTISDFGQITPTFAFTKTSNGSGSNGGTVSPPQIIEQPASSNVVYADFTPASASEGAVGEVVSLFGDVADVASAAAGYAVPNINSYLGGSEYVGMMLKVNAINDLKGTGLTYTEITANPYSPSAAAIWGQAVTQLPIASVACQGSGIVALVQMFTCHPPQSMNPSKTLSVVGWSSFANEAMTMAEFLYGVNGVDPFVLPGGPVSLNSIVINYQYLSAYKGAQQASGCANMPWQLLPAIAQQETGQYSNPAYDNAQPDPGMMQMSTATFQEYEAFPPPPNGAVPQTQLDPIDAIYAAAKDLCANGAGSPSTLMNAIGAYNCGSLSSCPPGWTYGMDVMSYLRDFESQSQGVSATLAGVIAFAESQVGTPYVWGGTGGSSGGFDCSGLTQAAYTSVNISIPRVAQNQFNAATSTASPVPGDLVFFGGSSTSVQHVGIYLGKDPSNAKLGLMVDAPHAGAFVRTEPFPLQIGAYWGTEQYLGAGSFVA